RGEAARRDGDVSGSGGSDPVGRVCRGDESEAGCVHQADAADPRVSEAGFAELLPAGGDGAANGIDCERTAGVADEELPILAGARAAVAFGATGIGGGEAKGAARGIRAPAAADSPIAGGAIQGPKFSREHGIVVRARPGDAGGISRTRGS